MKPRSRAAFSALFFILLASLALPSCGNQKSDRASVSVTIPGFDLPHDDRLYSRNPLRSATTATTPLLPPEDITGFKCIAVNIMGPGIPNSDSNPDRSPASVIADFGTKNFCSYPGKFSAIVDRSTFGNTLTIENVPTGENRIVEVIGIQVPAGEDCPTSVNQDSGDALFYHLGHKVVTISAGNNEVPIDNKYATTYPRLFALAGCGDVPIKISTTTNSGSCMIGFLNPTDYRYYDFKVAEGGSAIPLIQVKIMAIAPIYPSSNFTRIENTTTTSNECVPGTTILGNSGPLYCRMKYVSSSGNDPFVVPKGFEVRVRVYEQIEQSGGYFPQTGNFFETTLRLDAPCS